MRRRRVRGQSTIEFALIAPLFFMLLLGASDLAESFFLSIETNGAARAGMRDAVLTSTADIGAEIRQEPNSAIPCTPQVWGQAFAPCTGTGPQTPGGYADCISNTQQCGDPQGCDPIHSSFWTTPGPGTSALPIACFTEQQCTRTNTNSTGPFTCTYDPSWSSGKWGNTRPPGCNGTTCNYYGVVVKVVYKYTPNTPLIASFVAGTGGSFYLTQVVTGMQTY